MGRPDDVCFLWNIESQTMTQIEPPPVAKKPAHRWRSRRFIHLDSITALFKEKSASLAYPFELKIGIPALENRTENSNLNGSRDPLHTTREVQRSTRCPLDIRRITRSTHPYNRRLLYYCPHNIRLRDWCAAWVDIHRPFREYPVEHYATWASENSWSRLLVQIQVITT